MNNQKRNNSASLMLLGIMLLFSSGCNKDDLLFEHYKLSDAESSQIKVGLYMGYGVWDHSKTPTKEMLDKLNCKYVALNKDSIVNGSLSNYDLLLMPGGNMWDYKNHLSTTGMEEIRKFVSNGGGYFGICGGSYFAANKMVWRGWADENRKELTKNGLALFDGIADGPIEDFAPDYEDSKCKIEIIDSAHLLCNDVPDIITPFYSFGPEFIVDNLEGIDIIGKTKNGNKNAILAFNYNSGRVFLSSTHFEVDNTYTSWSLLKNAIIWCSNN